MSHPVPFHYSSFPQIKNKLLTTSDPCNLPIHPTHRKRGKNIIEKENQTHHQFPQGDSDDYRLEANEDVCLRDRIEKKEEGRKKKPLYI